MENVFRFWCFGEKDEERRGRKRDWKIVEFDVHKAMAKDHAVWRSILNFLMFDFWNGNFGGFLRFGGGGIWVFGRIMDYSSLFLKRTKTIHRLPRLRSLPIAFNDPSMLVSLRETALDINSVLLSTRLREKGKGKGERSRREWKIDPWRGSGEEDEKDEKMKKNVKLIEKPGANDLYSV